MLAPSLPSNEAARLLALRALKILDTAPEERYDRITAFARELFQVPVALVSLIDHDRQWFKARAGLDASQTPRAVSFCGHAILSADLFVVEDATVDERFRDNPLVTGPPFVRFYAGVPLNADGFRVGTLCAIDHKARRFGDRDRKLLKGLGGWVERELTIMSDLQTMAVRMESQARLEAVLEGIAEGVITTDPAGEIQTANPAAGGIFRCDPKMLLGRNLSELVPPRERAAHSEYMRRLDQLPDPLVRSGMEATGQRSDGSEFPVELSFSRLNFDGRRIYSGVLRDISERRQIERMKSDFISTVSHELRTPLTSIRGALGLVYDGAAGEINDTARQMVQIAYNNSERLVTLINDLLDMEKIEAGKMSFEMQPIRMSLLLDRAVMDNSGYATAHGVRFEIVGDILDVQINADHDRMMQVLTNLLSNAAKFSPEGEPVSVSAELREGHMIRVSVQDRGPGIPVEFHDRIFGKFAQADSSDTRQKGGTGLGLSISKAIVEKHEGSIGFRTEQGKGTVFFFDLPVWSAPTARPDAAETRATGARILICEDDKDIARLLSMMLEQAGFQPEIAHTAQQARQKLSGASYAAMTLDLGLPDQDGISLIRELRGQQSTRDLPIVVISARAAQGARELNGEAIGIIDWLEKPIDVDRLARCLHGICRPDASGVPRILHVEDDLDVHAVVAALVGNSAVLVSATTLQEAVRLLSSEYFDLLILDLTLPDGSGEDILPLLNQDSGKHTRVIIFSASDVSAGTAAKVQAALTKTRTSNAQLLNTIRSNIALAGA